MKYRKLGRNGPSVSAISMGRGAHPIKFEETDLVRAFDASIRRAYDLGINFYDSSDAYWGTRHEVLLGKAVKGFRDKVLISSKFGNIDLPDGKKGANGKPEYLTQCCEDSLKRMGVGDYLPPKKFRADTLASKLARLINSKSVAQTCAEYRGKMAAQMPPARVADLLSPP